MRRSRPKPGTIIRVATGRGYRYLRYVGRYAAALGDVFEVLAGGSNEPQDGAELAGKPTEYVFASLASILLTDERLEVVGTYPFSFSLPPFRMCTFGGWLFKDSVGNREWMVPKLSDSDAASPILQLVPADAIISRLESNWRPEDDRDDAIAMLARIRKQGYVKSDDDRYVGFATLPSVASREVCADALREEGLLVEADSAGDPTEIRISTAAGDPREWSAFRSRCAEAVSACGGEITGWEGFDLSDFDLERDFLS